ncbi:TPA: hypothetical protein IAB95_02635 [Candidatus Ventrenecus avicola]|nr:hypothetical protein [Candidatus Ventrenecus avicola]
MVQQSKKETILKEKMEENTLAIYLEDEPIHYIPEKDSGYTLDLSKSSCTNGVEVSFDYNTWTIKTNYSNYAYENNERVKCSLYFKKRTFAEAVVDCGALSKDGGTCIKENYSLTSEIVDDETSDNNLRFIGANPNNYVWFNDELWRIIGVMNNIDDGSDTLKTRLKIIRDEPIGSYSWDNKANGVGSSISDHGSNDWSDSALQQVLNSEAYWNRTSGECPYGGNGATTTCDFSNTGLTSEAKIMISNAVWNLGGSIAFDDVTASTFYERERGTTVYTGRPTEWTGQIGLVYPSDYGYATSGGSTGRDTCLAMELYNWDSSSDCYNNDWLYNSSNYQWTLTPDSSRSNNVFLVGILGLVGTYYANHTNNAVSPVLYLSSNVRITGGDGSRDNPFQLSL